MVCYKDFSKYILYYHAHRNGSFIVSLFHLSFPIEYHCKDIVELDSESGYVSRRSFILVDIFYRLKSWPLGNKFLL